MTGKLCFARLTNFKQAQAWTKLGYFLENAEEGVRSVGLARLRVWHGNINNENTSGHQEEPNVELDDDVDIADDMMLANGIEQAVEDAGAEVVELDEADYRKLHWKMVDNCHKG